MLFSMLIGGSNGGIVRDTLPPSGSNFLPISCSFGVLPVWEILHPPLNFSGKSSFCLIVVSILNPLDEVAYVNRGDVAVIFAESQ